MVGFSKNLLVELVIFNPKVMELLKIAKRKTLILIVNECLDLLSFESIKLLKHQPVTRFPSLHIAYALFKQHQGTIQAGYKIIKKSEDLGSVKEYLWYHGLLDKFTITNTLYFLFIVPSLTFFFL